LGSIYLPRVAVAVTNLRSHSPHKFFKRNGKTSIPDRQIQYIDQTITDFQEETKMNTTQFSNANSNIKGTTVDRNYLECETMFAQANVLVTEKRSQESVKLLLKILESDQNFV
jgi:hypothetical protein